MGVALVGIIFLFLFPASRARKVQPSRGAAAVRGFVQIFAIRCEWTALTSRYVIKM